MSRKIEWYEEVLALEPGSRVFFPLAKLFAEEGRLEDALRTLRLGLDRHPDALEARLLLVEVLTRLDRQDEAREQALLAVKPLERYPAFWTHWARENVETNRDFAMYLMLVASQFSDKPAKWADVVLEGLHSFMDRLNAGGASTSRRIRPQAAPRPQQPAPAVSAYIEGAPESFAAPSVPTSLSQAVNILSQEAPPAFQPAPEAPFSEPAFAAPHVAPAYVAPAYTGPATADPAQDPVPAGLSFLAAAVTAPAPAPSVQRAPAVEAAQEPGLDAPYEGPAPDAKSFRTRTMAELLASQGDFAGALGIYRELWGRSHDAQEKAELSERIRRLEADLAQASAPEAEVKQQAQEDPFGKHAKNRLMSTLEALAARLEARVQG